MAANACKEHYRLPRITWMSEKLPAADLQAVLDLWGVILNEGAFANNYEWDWSLLYSLLTDSLGSYRSYFYQEVTNYLNIIWISNDCDKKNYHQFWSQVGDFSLHIDNMQHLRVA